MPKTRDMVSRQTPTDKPQEDLSKTYLDVRDMPPVRAETVIDRAIDVISHAEEKYVKHAREVLGHDETCPESFASLHRMGIILRWTQFLAVEYNRDVNGPAILLAQFHKLTGVVTSEVRDLIERETANFVERMS